MHDSSIISLNVTNKKLREQLKKMLKLQEKNVKKMIL